MPDSLRLQGPLSANGTGCVEIFYHGQWGTICNYGWDMRYARVFVVILATQVLLEFFQVTKFLLVLDVYG